MIKGFDMLVYLFTNIMNVSTTVAWVGAPWAVSIVTHGDPATQTPQI